MKRNTMLLVLSILAGCGDELPEVKKTDVTCTATNSCNWFTGCADGYECREVEVLCGKTVKRCMREKTTTTWKVKAVEVPLGPVKIQAEPQETPRTCKSPSGWEYACGD